MPYRKSLVVFFVVAGACVTHAIDISTRLMHYTFKLEGGTANANRKTIGTAFAMAGPDSVHPGKGQMILITAAHLLEGMTGEYAKIYVPKRRSDGHYEKTSLIITIRNRDIPIWAKHPTADVAALYVKLPPFFAKQSTAIPALSVDALADDSMIAEYEIHAGDELLCLGYPRGAEANAMGFPILRSGCIASYPIIPSREIGPFLFDCEVLPGNSGGPVYFVDRNRTYGGEMHIGESIEFVMGLVSEQKLQFRVAIQPTGTDMRISPLKLGVVIPAHFIKETIHLLKRQCQKK